VVYPLSFTVRSKTVFAILGGSGSGKTTLLNVIAGRYKPSQWRVSGSVRLRGADGSVYAGQEADVIGYVTQEDFLLPYLTVRETLTYAALLRMGAKHCTDKDRQERVDSIILV
jgi:ABC-type multidrug transport system ATPase subunit